MPIGWCAPRSPDRGGEGIRLVQLRAEVPDSRYGDREWADAGIARDVVGQAYIVSLLDFELMDSRDHPGWSFDPGLVTMTRYRYVDVAQSEGTYLRYRLASQDKPGAVFAVK